MTATLLTWILACAGSAVPIPVSEAFDVPPPPAQVSLELGPGAWDADVGPGAVLDLGGVRVEVVDRRGDTLTVYAEEGAVVERWLRDGRIMP